MSTMPPLCARACTVRAFHKRLHLSSVQCKSNTHTPTHIREESPKKRKVGRWPITAQVLKGQYRGRSQIIQPEQAEHLLPNQSIRNIFVQSAAATGHLYFDPERLTAFSFCASSSDKSETAFVFLHLSARPAPSTFIYWQAAEVEWFRITRGLVPSWLLVQCSRQFPLCDCVCWQLSQFPIYEASAKDQVCKMDGQSHNS